MNIDDYSFHDSIILRVIEHTDKKSVDYYIDFPIIWENNLFKKRILRFTDVYTHIIEEIPFAGNPSILEIINHGQIEKTFGKGRNKFKHKTNKIEIRTNAGIRIIEFTNCDLLKIEE